MFAALLLASQLSDPQGVSVSAPAALVNFDSQVLPLLTRAGCNAGACHGAAAGRGGFHLSLFGSDPKADYASIVQFAEGRRVNLVDANKSLILAKPLGQLDHGGDVVFEEDSSSVAILQTWLKQGAKRGPQRRLLDLRIDPADAIAIDQVQSIPLRAIARFSDGKETDVTEWTLFHSDDPASVEIFDGPMRALCHRPGKHVILARFWNRIVPVSISLPYDRRLLLPISVVTSLNFVDAEIDAQLTQLNLTANGTAGDASFLRRLQLDLTGRLPTPEELRSFQSNVSSESRMKRIDAMLESPEFSSFWALRMARWFKLRGSPEEPQSTLAYSEWILKSLESRRPYNEMVRELLTAVGDSHVIGAANFSRSVSDARQQAELVSSVFLGTRIQCANCHNHPYANWTQDDYHGLAAVFARLDRSRTVALKERGSVTNTRTGELAIPRIPGFRDLTESEPALERFTNWILEKDNPHFAKAIVNRLWDAMMGRGLVSDVDDFRETNPPSHALLLDKLATDFVTNKYDLRHTLRVIASSNAYARSSKLASQTNELETWYGASNAKPLLPEVHLDAIEDVLGLEDQNSKAGRIRAITLLDPTSASPELDALGRCSRSEVCQERGQQQGLAAKLHSINGEILNRRIADQNGRLHVQLRDGKDPLSMIEDFFMRALAKRPSENQRKSWLEELSRLTGDEQTQWLEDFVWAMLSSQDFSTNR